MKLMCVLVVVSSDLVQLLDMLTPGLAEFLYDCGVGLREEGQETLNLMELLDDRGLELRHVHLEPVDIDEGYQASLWDGGVVSGDL